MDLQCSLQLEMPAACQKSLVKCPLPTEDALNSFISLHLFAETMHPHKYSSCLINLGLVVTDICACVSTADLVEDDGGSLERHAMSLSSALQGLENWRTQLPSELMLSRGTEMLNFECDMALPSWRQRQVVVGTPLSQRIHADPASFHPSASCAFNDHSTRLSLPVCGAAYLQRIPPLNSDCRHRLRGLLYVRHSLWLVRGPAAALERIGDHHGSCFCLPAEFHDSPST